MIEILMRPVLDRAVGVARIPMRIALGSTYDSMSRFAVSEATGVASTAFLDEQFNRRQSAQIRALVAEKTRAMAPADFAEMLRAAIKEDEWLLILHGAVLGILAGLAHLMVFGP